MGPDPDPDPEPRPVVHLASVPGLTNESPITITGTTAANATVEVSGGASAASGNSNAQGAFSVSVALNLNQSNNLSVVAIKSGVRSIAVTVTVVHDDIAPEIVDLDVPTHTSDDPLTLSGSTEAGARVIAKSPADTVETTANASGDFSLAVHLAPNSSNQITCVAQDAAGNEGPESTAVVIHDDIAPVIVDLDLPTHTNEDPLTLSGSTDAGAKVIAKSPVDTVETTADGSGAFSLAVHLALNSSNEITCVAQDSTGNEGPESVAVVIHDDIAPDAVDVDVPTHTSDDPLTLSGSTEAGAKVIAKSPADTAETTADASGAFSLAVHLAPNSSNEITFVAQDAAGNEGPESAAVVIHDDIAPGVVDVDVPTHTNEDPLTLSGSTEAGATVTATSPVDTVETTADGSGAFTLAVHLAPNSSNEITCVAQDSTGNEGPESVAVVIHDDIAPEIVDLDVPTHTNEDPLTLSGSTEAGATVTATSPVDTVEATADGSGAFTLAVHLDPNSSNEITCEAQDPAGNEGSETAATVIHDDIVPTLTIESPSGATFDTDRDLRVNIEFSYDDVGSGMDLTSVSVSNNRGIGGGSARGGIDAGFNMLPSGSRGPARASYNASLDHEFPGGANTLTVTVADLAGNDRTETVEFTVTGTEPSFTITQPADGGSPPLEGFAIVSEFSDVAGVIDEGSLTVAADASLIGLLSQEGPQPEDVPAGENLGHLFSITSSAAEFPIGSSYTFPAGTVTLTGEIADRAGNISPASSVTFTVPSVPHTLLVVNSTAAPGATGHPISIGLTSFAPFGGAQFTLQFDASVFTVDSLSSAVRVPFSPFYELSINGTAGELKVILVDLNGRPIPEGSSVVVDIYASVSAEAAVQDAALTLTGAQISDISGNPVDFVVLDGVLRIR